MDPFGLSDPFETVPLGAVGRDADRNGCGIGGRLALPLGLGSVAVRSGCGLWFLTRAAAPAAASARLSYGDVPTRAGEGGLLGDLGLRDCFSWSVISFMDSGQMSAAMAPGYGAY